MNEKSLNPVLIPPACEIRITQIVVESDSDNGTFEHMLHVLRIIWRKYLVDLMKKHNEMDDRIEHHLYLRSWYNFVLEIIFQKKSY